MKKYLGPFIGFVFGFTSTFMAPFTLALFVIPLSTVISKIPLFGDVDLFETNIIQPLNYWVALVFVGFFWSLFGLIFQYLIQKKYYVYLIAFITIFILIFRFSFDKFYEFDYVRIAKSKRIVTAPLIVPVVATSTAVVGG